MQVLKALIDEPRNTFGFEPIFKVPHGSAFDFNRKQRLNASRKGAAREV